MEIVTAARAQDGVAVTPTPTNSAAEWDSDLEAEPDPVDWSKGVDEEVLKHLSARELKRQEVINGMLDGTTDRFGNCCRYYLLSLCHGK